VSTNAIAASLLMLEQGALEGRRNFTDMLWDLRSSMESSSS